MKFKLIATSCLCCNTNLLCHYELLKDSGFNIQLEDSDYPTKCFIEINTLEDLLRLREVLDIEIIIHNLFKELTIEIYDDYRE